MELLNICGNGLKLEEHTQKTNRPLLRGRKTTNSQSEFTIATQTYLSRGVLLMTAI